MPDPKMTPEQIILIRAIQALAASNLKLIKSVDSLANSVNDMVVVMESLPLEQGAPPGTPLN